jgi:hypothetical protein
VCEDVGNLLVIIGSGGSIFVGNAFSATNEPLLVFPIYVQTYESFIL